MCYAFSASFILFLIFFLCSASAQSVDIMILGRFMVGIGIGVNTGLVPMYISEVHPSLLSLSPSRMTSISHHSIEADTLRWSTKLGAGLSSIISSYM